MRKVSNLFFAILLCVFCSACSFWKETVETIHEEEVSDESRVTAIAFNKTELSGTVGDLEYLKVTITPSDVQNKVTPEYLYESDKIAINPSSDGVVITYLQAGNTYIKAKCNGIVTTCLIYINEGTVDAWASDPYIYSGTSVLQTGINSNKEFSVSLYGGTVADMEDFTYEISDPRVATITAARNNVVVTGKNRGSAKITISHPKATYSYTVLCLVSSDSLTIPYITTDYNFVSINKTESTTKTIYFTVKNPDTSSANSKFHYEDVSTEENKGVVSFVNSDNSLMITALKTGIAKIQVTNDECEYPLDIIVRVTQIVKNTYIELSSSSVVLTGSDMKSSVTATIAGTSEYVNPDDFKWEIPDEAEALADISYIGNTLTVQGKKNGYFKIYCSHPMCENRRQLIVILTQQAGSAVDSSMYITTTNNYVQTKIGADETVVQVLLEGGDETDKNDFSWGLEGAENNPYIEVSTTDGNITNFVASREAVVSNSGKSVIGELHIKPRAIGKTKIRVTHTRILEEYYTDIIVQVYSADALLESPKTLTVTNSAGTELSIIRLVTDESQASDSAPHQLVLNAALANGSTADQQKISWSCDNSNISLSQNEGSTTTITASGSGSGQCYLTVSHPDSLNTKKLVVMYASSAEELAKMKSIYSDETYKRIAVGGDSKSCEIKGFNLDSTDKINWTSNRTECVSITASGDYSATGTLNAISATNGNNATVTATLYSNGVKNEGVLPVEFEVVVLPEGESPEVITAKYLTTMLNSFVLTEAGDTYDISVTGVGMSESEMNKTTWESLDPEVATVSSSSSISSNKSTTTVTAVKGGKTKLRASNPIAANDYIDIDVKVGEVYEWTDDNVCYIITEKDTYTMVNGGDPITIGASLNSSSEATGFTFTATDGADNVEMTPSRNGTCIIEPKQAGKTIIQITHPDAVCEKEILVVIANSEEELKGFKYLTTSQNVVTVGQSQKQTVSVSVENADEAVLSGWRWSCSDESIVSVEYTGATAVFYGKGIGTAKVTVSNQDYCDYPLDIIVNCVDPIAAAENPYITCQNIVTLKIGSDYSELTADLIGGSESDYSDFTWNVEDPSLVGFYYANETAHVKATKAGVTRVVIHHPKASVDRTVLIICEKAASETCYITTSESIIKMSPSDSAKTITATLNGGSSADEYSFRWYADSYDIIDMSYTNGSCVITPLSTGTVNLYVEHPKAEKKTIIITISKYDNFKFSDASLTMTAGVNQFVNLEVPDSSVETGLIFTSSDSNICSTGAYTSNTVVLEPKSAGYATITAKLIALNSDKTVMGTSQLLVYVQPADVTEPYIYTDTASLITPSKGSTVSLSASVRVDGKVQSGFEKNITFDVENVDTDVVNKNSLTYKNGYCQFEIKNSGAAVLKISHPDCTTRNIYIQAQGIDAATLDLNYTALSMYVSDSPAKIKATITNPGNANVNGEIVSDTEGITWELTDQKVSGTEGTQVVTLAGAGTQVTITPVQKGTATLVAKLPSNGTTKSVSITVDDPPSLIFDTSDLLLTPGSEKTINYTLYPIETPDKNNTVLDFVYSDAKYFLVTDNKDYDQKTGKGSFRILGKQNEGSAMVTFKSRKYVSEAKVSIDNSYNYYFTLDKSLLSATPNGTEEKTLVVKYTIRPSYAEVYFNKSQLDTNFTGGGTVTVVNNGYSLKNYSVNGSSLGESYVFGKDHGTIDEVTDLRTGEIQFKVKGQVFLSKSGSTDYSLLIGSSYEITQSITTSDGKTTTTSQIKQADTKKLAIEHYYTKLNFVLDNNDGSFQPIAGSKHTRYDKSTASIIFGDGEGATITPYTKEFGKSYIGDGKCFSISEITFDDSNGGDSFNKKYIKVDGNGGNSIDTDVERTVTNDKANTPWTIKIKYNRDIKNWATGSSNTATDKSAVLECVYLGTLNISYKTSSNTSDTYKIKVYYEVRNE